MRLSNYLVRCEYINTRLQTTHVLLFGPSQTNHNITHHS